MSKSAPDLLPQPATCSAISTVGMLMTHSPVLSSNLKELFRSLIMQPGSGGSNFIIVCHDIVMMFGRSLVAVVSRMTGPGSS